MQAGLVVYWSLKPITFGSSSVSVHISSMTTTGAPWDIFSVFFCPFGFFLVCVRLDFEFSVSYPFGVVLGWYCSLNSFMNDILYKMPFSFNHIYNLARLWNKLGQLTSILYQQSFEENVFNKTKRLCITYGLCITLLF